MKEREEEMLLFGKLAAEMLLFLAPEAEVEVEAKAGTGQQMPAAATQRHCPSFVQVCHQFQEFHLDQATRPGPLVP